MIEKKLSDLKRLMSDMDRQKLQNSNKIDSISLISQNLSRTNQSRIKGNEKRIQRDNDKWATNTSSFNLKQGGLIKHFKLEHKSYSLNYSVCQKSPKLLFSYNNEANKKNITILAKKLYEARNLDMGTKYSQTGQQEFIKTFLMKNSKHGVFRADRVDLSGLGIVGNSLKVVSFILKDYKFIDLSRNTLKAQNLLNLKKSTNLQELILKNCSMKNQQLCKLFEILQETPIKKLSICSPDIKDRNNLTKYDQLYKLIQISQSLETLEMSNIQISPESEIFFYAKKSKSLKRLNVSKNTHVSGMCKNLIQLNLSWNAIKKPHFLKCNESALQKLDLTGNLIPSYSFEDQLVVANYPKIKCLIFDKMIINVDGFWLQRFIQSSRTIQRLSLAECGLTKNTLLNVIYGLGKNISLKYLNLSGNKIPEVAAQPFETSIRESMLTHLSMQLCDITDACGAILFRCIKNNTHIQHIDVSKNTLSYKSSQVICTNLKTSCYSLLSLVTNQNFIKYDQLKQIEGYIGRNVYMAKTKIMEEHRKFKNMNSNNAEIIKKVQDAEKALQELRNETLNIEDIYMKKEKQNELIDAMILQQKINLLRTEQQALEQQIMNMSNQLQIQDQTKEKAIGDHGEQNPEVDVKNN